MRYEGHPSAQCTSVSTDFISYLIPHTSYLFLPAPKKQIEPFHTRPHLTVGHTALEHPESAVRMDIANAPGAQQLLRLLDPAGDVVRCLDQRRLHIEDAQPDAEA